MRVTSRSRKRQGNGFPYSPSFISNRETFIFTFWSPASLSLSLNWFPTWLKISRMLHSEYLKTMEDPDHLGNGRDPQEERGAVD